MINYRTRTKAIRLERARTLPASKWYIIGREQRPFSSKELKDCQQVNDKLSEASKGRSAQRSSNIASKQMINYWTWAKAVQLEGARTLPASKWYTIGRGQRPFGSKELEHCQQANDKLSDASKDRLAWRSSNITSKRMMNYTCRWTSQKSESLHNNQKVFGHESSSPVHRLKERYK